MERKLGTSLFDYSGYSHRIETLPWSAGKEVEFQFEVFFERAASIRLFEVPRLSELLENLMKTVV